MQGAAVVWLPPASNVSVSNAGASGWTDVGDKPRGGQIKSDNCLILHKKVTSAAVPSATFTKGRPLRVSGEATGDRSAAAAVNI